MLPFCCLLLVVWPVKFKIHNSSPFGCIFVKKNLFYLFFYNNYNKNFVKNQSWPLRVQLLTDRRRGIFREKQKRAAAEGFGVVWTPTKSHWISPSPSDFVLIQADFKRIRGEPRRIRENQRRFTQNQCESLWNLLDSIRICGNSWLDEIYIYI